MNCRNKPLFQQQLHDSFAIITCKTVDNTAFKLQNVCLHQMISYTFNIAALKILEELVLRMVQKYSHV